nr:MAG TPA: hypothetical protein [Caudoviricetes sp.]
MRQIYKLISTFLMRLSCFFSSFLSFMLHKGI